MPACEPQEGRALLAAGVIHPAASVVLPPDAQAAAYRAAVLRETAAFHAPGAVAGVWVPGQRAWTTAEGLADVATGRRMTLGDHFAVRSVTKSYTVTAVLRLARGTGCRSTTRSRGTSPASRTAARSPSRGSRG